MYHAWLFSRINPVAPLFAGLFLVEAMLLAWFGVVRGRIAFSSGARLWRAAGMGLAIYAMAYPFVNLLLGHEYPRVPTFGVPCPTAILTIGLLLTTGTARPTVVVAIPIVWGFIGGSAALVLGVTADYVLLGAGLLLGIHTLLGHAALQTT